MRALILLALLGAAVAVPRNPQRIVGGTPTTVETYPYMSNMQFILLGVIWSQACGGSLITNNHVLSAAHCYAGDLPTEWVVRLGSSFPSSGGTIHAVSQLIVHAQYNSATIDNDIAIVRLASSVEFGPSVGAASIAGASYNVADGTQVTAIGWGTLADGGPSPDQLQHVDINVINQQLCAERYAYLKTQPDFALWPDITDNMLCAGILDVGGKDACQGDAGGPLVHKLDANTGFVDVVIGIVSWGYSCADPVYPGVSARVSRFSDWINNNAI